MKAVGEKIGTARLKDAAYYVLEHPDGYIVIADMKTGEKVTHSDSTEGLKNAGYVIDLDPVPQAETVSIEELKAKVESLRGENELLRKEIYNLTSANSVKVGEVVPNQQPSLAAQALAAGAKPAPGATTKTFSGQ